MNQPNFSDAAAYRVWIRDHYPQQVAALLADSKPSPPHEFADTSRKEIAERKWAIAHLAAEHACKLMQEAHEFDAEWESKE